jgi:isopenicillin-N epimerase
VLDAVLAAVTPRTKLAMLDHVTSPTALVLPIAELVAALAARGVDTLVDGAHGVGLVPVDLEALGAAYYTTNCHKWLCAPKGCAVLWARPDRQASVRPLSISHGARSPRADRSRFLLEHDWTGTYDPSAVLALPRALEVLEASHPRGLAGRRDANRALALEARALLAAALEVEPPAPVDMLAAMVALPLPDGDAERLYERLFTEHAIEVPIVPFPSAPRRLVRVSAQVYSRLEDYARLAEVLPAELARERAGA